MPMSNSESRKRLAERHAEPTAAQVDAMQQANDLSATLAAVRAWAAKEHGAKSELLRVLGDAE